MSEGREQPVSPGLTLWRATDESHLLTGCGDCVDCGHPAVHALAHRKEARNGLG